MNRLDEQNLDTAIVLGSAVCKELGICCDKRGRVIFQIYQKLEELRSTKPVSSEIVDGGTSDQAESEKPEF